MTTEEKLAQSMGIDYEIKQTGINGYKINYLKAGFGPPLLLIHGANFGWGIWYPNIPELSKHFTVYAIDLPGAGRSTLIDYSKLDVEKDFYEVVCGFLSDLNLDKINVVGHSVGGWVALKLAIQKPDKINKIAIFDSGGFSEKKNFFEKVIGFYPLAKVLSKTVLKVSLNNKMTEKFFRSTFFNKNVEIKKEFFDYYYESVSRSHNLLFISRISYLHNLLFLGSNLKEINTPVLIGWGREDKILSLADSKKFFSFIPCSEVVTFDQAAHNPFLEQGVEFNRKVINFLKF